MCRPFSACAARSSAAKGWSEISRSSQIQARLRKATSSVLAQLMPSGYGFAQPPVAPLSDEFAKELVVARQPPRLRQRDEMLMAVQLPDDLVIAHRLKIQKRNSIPRRQRTALSMNNIEMPVDFVSIAKAAKSQQAELMAADALRFTNDVLDFCGSSRRSMSRGCGTSPGAKKNFPVAASGRRPNAGPIARAWRRIAS